MLFGNLVKIDRVINKEDDVFPSQQKASLLHSTLLTPKPEIIFSSLMEYCLSHNSLNHVGSSLLYG